MRTAPELLALRDDPGLQREAQRALFARMEVWRRDARIAPVFDELERYARRGAIGECPHLSALFDPASGAAEAFLATLFETAAAALAANPLAHIPFRHFCDDALATLQLARCDNAMLVIEAIDGDRFAKLKHAENVEFKPAEVFERVVAGSATGELIRCENVEADRADLETSGIALGAGRVLQLEARRDAVVLRAVEGRLVTLRLLRREPAARPAREFRIADGMLAHQAAGSVLESRVEMMMALLGRMNWQQAAPVMARIAQGTGPRSLRWQAVRECLALDTATGFATLTVIAQSAEDDLAPAAGALRSQLIETYPQLREVA